MATQTAPEELLTRGSIRVPVAVREYGVSRSRLYEWMAAQRLPFCQLGRVRVIPRLALERLLALEMQGGTSAE